MSATTKQVLDLNRIDPTQIRQQTKWFNEEIAKLAKQKLSPAKIVGSSGINKTQTLIPGKMYFFYYDPLHKDTLPYYDQFPLIIPFAKTDKSFTALNMHYVDYRTRILILNELIKITGAKTSTDNKIKYSWALIKSVAKLNQAKACVKMYLDDHVKSPFCEVPRGHWHTAMMLPVHRFVGAKAEHIWKESRAFK